METYRKLASYAKVREGRGQDLLVVAGITVLFARLFYRSIFGLALFLPVYLFYRNYRARGRMAKRKKELLKEFQSCMEMVSASLLSGYALENAFAGAQRELEQLYGKESPMKIELEKINRQVGMNQPIEKVFSEFAAQSGIEEMESFAEILAFAKRSGGDLIHVIQKTVENIGMKLQAEEEIQTMIAEKKLEQQAMNLMPIFLLGYLELASPGYLDVLYGNLPGALFMSACLVAYAAVFRLAERLGNIEV